MSHKLFTIGESGVADGYKAPDQMHRGLCMNPQRMFKIKFTADAIWYDLLDLASLPLVKALLWLLLLATAFAALAL